MRAFVECESETHQAVAAATCRATVGIVDFIQKLLTRDVRRLSCRDMVRMRDGCRHLGLGTRGMIDDAVGEPDASRNGMIGDGCGRLLDTASMSDMSLSRDRGKLNEHHHGGRHHNEPDASRQKHGRTLSHHMLRKIAEKTSEQGLCITFPICGSCHFSTSINLNR